MTVDGHRFRSSCMALGDSRHELPVQAGVRGAIGEEAGRAVEAHLTARLP